LVMRGRGIPERFSRPELMLFFFSHKFEHELETCIP
jgi:hypothetical protein